MYSSSRLNNPVREDRIATMTGDDFTVLAILSDVSQFPGCVQHTIAIGRGDFSKTLTIHAQGVAPEVGAAVKRMRIGGNGTALIWAYRADGRAAGGGFTLAAVPPDWRGLKNPIPAPSRGRDAPVGKPMPASVRNASDEGDL